MRNFLFIFATLLFCSACRTVRQTEGQHHAQQHTADTLAAQATGSTHTVAASITEAVNNSNLVVDITETVEHFDTAGNVTQKTTTNTRIQRNDSTATVTTQLAEQQDTAAINIHFNAVSDSKQETSEKKKTKRGTSFLGKVAIGIFLVFFIAVIVFVSHIARKLICKM